MSSTVTLLSFAALLWTTFSRLRTSRTSSRTAFPPSNTRKAAMLRLRAWSPAKNLLLLPVLPAAPVLMSTASILVSSCSVGSFYLACLMLLSSGIYIAHSSFGGRAKWGATYGGYASQDGNGHGTHTAGTGQSIYPSH